jgi:hypothetical protein
MISAFLFVVSIFSITFHISMGMAYFSQFALNGNAHEPATALDPCGFTSLGYFFSTSTPALHTYITNPLVLTYLRTIGFAMISLGIMFYYETLFLLRFKSTNHFGLLHFFYMRLCVGGFRNRWADVDYLWPWFLFHLFLSLCLLKFKRIEIYSITELNDKDDDTNSETTFSFSETDDIAQSTETED